MALVAEAGSTLPIRACSARADSVGFPGRSGWRILSALIRFWERKRCRRPTLLIFEATRRLFVAHPAGDKLVTREFMQPVSHREADRACGKLKFLSFRNSERCEFNDRRGVFVAPTLGGS